MELIRKFTERVQWTIQEGVFEARERNAISGRIQFIRAVLGHYEFTLLEKQFVGRVKEYIQKNDMISEQQESISEGIYREKVRYLKKTTQGEGAFTGKSPV